MRSVRSDDAGRFRFAGLAPDAYRVSVLRIGYAELARDLRLAERDTTVIVSLIAVPQALTAMQVRADVSAVYGTVGRLPDLLPLAGAKVQIMGASKVTDVDSAGAFFLPVGKPGTYFIRITKPGFAEQRFPIEVPNGRAVDASRLLDPSPIASHPALEHFYADADERLRSRGPNSALVPGSQVREGGNNLIDALHRSPSFSQRGLRFGPTVCVFINGRATAMPLEGINVDEIEAVEVYGLRGDVTATLTWQQNKCVSVSRSMPRRSGVANSPELVRSVVVWLKP